MPRRHGKDPVDPERAGPSEVHHDAGEPFPSIHDYDLSEEDILSFMEQDDVERTEEAHFTGDEQPHADADAADEEEEEEQDQGNEYPQAAQRPAPRRQAGYEVEFVGKYLFNFLKF